MSDIWDGNRFNSLYDCPPEGKYLGELVAAVPWGDRLIFLFEFQSGGRIYRAGVPAPNNGASEGLSELLRALKVKQVLGKQTKTSELFGRPLWIHTANTWSPDLKLYYLKVVSYEVVV